MRKLKWWLVHLVVFVVVQTMLLVAGQSWPAAFVNQSVPDPLTWGSAPAMWISRLWCVVFVVDTLWTAWAKFVRGRREDSTNRTDQDA